MSEYKEINEKPVWLVTKRYTAGLIEFVGVYWTKETAERVAMSNLPKNANPYAITLDQVTLHGSMIDKK